MAYGAQLGRPHERGGRVRDEFGRVRCECDRRHCVRSHIVQFLGASGHERWSERSVSELLGDDDAEREER